MYYRSCPMCNKPMMMHSIYSKLKNPQLIFVCDNCGYKTDRDMSGLTYSNIYDRYHFAAMKVERNE